MDYGQRNTINNQCYGCKFLNFWGNGYASCGNKYACYNNNKKKQL